MNTYLIIIKLSSGEFQNFLAEVHTANSIPDAITTLEKKLEERSMIDKVKRTIVQVTLIS